MRPLIQMDFVDRSRRLTWPGAILLLLGVTAAAAVAWDYNAGAQRRAGLEYRMTELLRARGTKATPADAQRDAKVTLSAQRAALDLATPWTRLLAELEQASTDSQGQVALLGVEPDHAKHAVRVTAEAISLDAAIGYSERLQSSRSLAYPMLDRHEVRADDAQHPVRFELSGVWRDAP